MPTARASVDAFASRLLDWYDDHGRRELPWQRDRTPYTIWLSEVMLQQTQVATVIPYFERFVQRFPSAHDLAAASLDEVLALWAGLGYYARARNLHAAAKMVVADHGGELPQSRTDLERLPGIGRSTAGAILALAHGRCEAILDGNVKRVLARYHAVEGWPGRAPVLRELWKLAARHTPKQRVADYTQAIMDLGAMLCSRNKPECGVCPLSRGCQARLHDRQEALPTRRPRTKRRRRRISVLLVRDREQGILLERRPTAGIWGGLYSLPELSVGDDVRVWCSRYLGTTVSSSRCLEPVEHAFTHFDLSLEPIILDIEAPARGVMDGGEWLWYKASREPEIGIAAPIASLLKSVQRSGERAE